MGNNFSKYFLDCLPNEIESEIKEIHQSGKFVWQQNCIRNLRFRVINYSWLARKRVNK
jgi:hypothetical protein